MKELNMTEVEQVNGAAFTAEHGIAGALVGGLNGAGVAGIYFTLATNPAGWVAMGIIGSAAALGSLTYMMR